MKQMKILAEFQNTILLRVSVSLLAIFLFSFLNPFAVDKDSLFIGKVLVGALNIKAPTEFELFFDRNSWEVVITDSLQPRLQQQAWIGEK